VSFVLESRQGFEEKYFFFFFVVKEFDDDNNIIQSFNACSQ